jgi:general stress protein YciG
MGDLMSRAGRLIELEARADKQAMSNREAGRIGGRVMAERIGAEGFRQMASRGGKSTMEKHGSRHYSKAGKRGGRKTRDSQGPKFYKEIGKKGAERAKYLIALGRAIENE